MAIRALRCRVATMATHGTDDHRQNRTYVCRSGKISSEVLGFGSAGDSANVLVVALVDESPFGASGPAHPPDGAIRGDAGIPPKDACWHPFASAWGKPILLLRRSP